MQVSEFRVWDADIVDPDAVSTDTASNVTSVGVINKCYYAIIYPCQFLEITFLVR